MNPLREGGFVGAEHMRQLRDLLGRAGSLEGLQDEEKEPEELLSMLFTEIFCIKPLLSFRYYWLCSVVTSNCSDLCATHTAFYSITVRYFK